jgi:hypothetical protein
MKRDCVALKRTANIPIPSANYSEYRNVNHDPNGLWHCTFAR